MIKNEKEIIKLIEEDEWMMEIIRAAKELHLPDWWICAGFVRSKIWDTLHGFQERTAIPDVDVIYFDRSNMSELEEKKLERKLKEQFPNIPWSVKNQARMHTVNKLPPYLSSVDAISKFPETATALGVKIDDNEQLILTAPCGIEDVMNLQLKPTPHFAQSNDLKAIYEERIEKKNWKSIWKEIEVHHISLKA